MTRILFVTWDGPQVNYLESLFLPIFAGLREHGIHIDVLQFRWGAPERGKASARACADLGLGYRSVDVHRWPRRLGPFVSAALGGKHVRAAVGEFASDILMPRSLMPALATLAAGGKRLRPIIFDADGLEADERVDFRDLSRSSPVYRSLRRIEAAIVRQSTAVLVRSRFAADLLAERSKSRCRVFHVVTNGRDRQLFKPPSGAKRLELRRKLDIAPEAPLVGYVGSLGGKYRIDQLAAFVNAIRSLRADARLLILSLDPTHARRLLASEDPLIAEQAVIVAAAPADVPDFLGTVDVGTAFIERTFSMQAVAPIKTGEYLLCGVPVIGTSGIGETGPLEDAGLFFDERRGGSAAADWMIGSVLPNRDDYRQRARDVGTQCFSLERSIDSYLQALASVDAA